MRTLVSRSKAAPAVLALSAVAGLFALAPVAMASLGSPYIPVRLMEIVVTLTTYGGVKCSPYAQGSFPYSSGRMDVFANKAYSYPRYTLTCGDIRIENAFTVTGSSTTNQAGAPTQVKVSNRINFYKKVSGTWTYKTYRNPSVSFSVTQASYVSQVWVESTAATSLSGTYDGGRAQIAFYFDYYDW